MQVKRFFAADMRQAMKLIREELGADAAIIGNRRVAGGVELIAAVGYPMPPDRTVRPNPALEAELRKTQSNLAKAQTRLAMAADTTDRLERDRPARPPVPPPSLTPITDRLLGQIASKETPVRETAPEPLEASVVPPASSSTESKAFDAMRSELTGLRQLLEMQMGAMAWSRLQSRNPQQAILWRRLQQMGLPAELSRELLKKVEHVTSQQQAWRLVLAYLAQGLKTPQVEPLEEGGVIALVGPAGVGKTTTLSKLAARYVLKYGPQDIALVSLDNFRIGAQEQLKTLGRILNVSVTAVGAGQSLPKALEALADKRVILIDTAGLPVSDPAFRAQLNALSDPRINAKNYLVLAATSQPQVLKAAWHSYRQCGLSGCIMTKLDEAGSLGDLLGLAISQRLPIVYLTDGPRIPDDLHLPRAHRLVSRAVSLQVEEVPSEETMADVFAGLYKEPARQLG